MPSSPEIPRGQRIYAIGDVHGRLDLLERLLAMIRRDNARRDPAAVRIILLGDLIDRGPSSAELIARCRALAETSDRFIVLKGNHEAMMVDALNGSFPALEIWLKQGGAAAMVSWGLPADLVELGPSLNLLAAARHLIPRDQVDWMDALPLTHRAGNCLFVHAGMRPGTRLTRQNPRDLLWIRDEFTGYEGKLPYVVVHGHSIREVTPELRNSRLAIDTGAYRTGRLTALGLEKDEYWTMMTEPRGSDRPPS